MNEQHYWDEYMFNPLTADVMYTRYRLGEPKLRIFNAIHPVECPTFIYKYI